MKIQCSLMGKDSPREPPLKNKQLILPSFREGIYTPLDSDKQSIVNHGGETPSWNTSLRNLGTRDHPLVFFGHMENLLFIIGFHQLFLYFHAIYITSF